MRRVVIVALVIAVAVSWLILRSGLEYGFSARDAPTAFEAWVARGMRVMAIPAADRNRSNPVPLDDAVLAGARRHFADHCASCHANDGSGETPIGKNLYPKAPDMRLDPTQTLSDGQLFYIIRNGIRLSGMPAWGDAPAEQDPESWGLVHFLRHLPKVSSAELDEMKTWNPVGRAETETEQQIENFLNGGEPPVAAPTHHGH